MPWSSGGSEQKALSQLALNEAMQSVDAGLPSINLGPEAPLGPQGAKELARALESNTTVRLLEMEGSNIQDDGAAALAKVLGMNRVLKMLDLGGNGIGDKGACKLAEGLDKNACLEQLDLVTNQVRSSGGARLAKAVQKNQVIRQISLTGNRIGHKGAKAFGEALEVNRSLKILNLAGNAASNVGASALARALAMPGSVLTELALGNNDITDDGAADLANMLKVNVTLKELQLDCNTIGDQGGTALAAALEVNRTLQTLWLVKNPLGGTAVEKFTQILQVNKSIRRLGMSSTARIPGDVLQGLEAVRKQRLAEVRAASKSDSQAGGAARRPAAPHEAPRCACGAALRLGARFCCQCGAPVQAPPEGQVVPGSARTTDSVDDELGLSTGSNELGFGHKVRIVPRSARVSQAGASGKTVRSCNDKVRMAPGDHGGGESDPDGDFDLDDDSQDEALGKPPSAEILAELHFLDDQLLYLDVDRDSTAQSQPGAQSGGPRVLGVRPTAPAAAAAPAPLAWAEGSPDSPSL